jgi:murein L,D-transpeptidase YafK
MRNSAVVQSTLRAVFGALLLFFVASVPAIAADDTTPEALLNRALEEINHNDLAAAQKTVDRLLVLKPEFRLANLIKGDLLLARSRELHAIGGASGAPVERLDDLRAEALARLNAFRERPQINRVPRYLLQLNPDQKHAIVVDTKKSRLYLYENDHGAPRFVADYYISIGKKGADKTREGDQKTPVGVYRVIASLPRNKLADLYGHGAYPLNYPNEWDKLHGRNGHGIWLHGTPSDTYSRPPRASDGCVVLANADLDAVVKDLQIGLTPVIISDDIEWLSLDDWNQERQALNDEIEQWRKDWESLNTDAYLKHYAHNFTSGGAENFARWSAQKRQVNSQKEWIKLKISDVSMFRNPGAGDMVVVTFEQDYHSSNLSNTMKKSQYWIKEDHKWRIVYEGAV